VASLTDNALGALYSGSGEDGDLDSSAYSIAVSEFGTVNLTGTSGASNKLSLGTIDYVLNKDKTWTN
jgi:hypothetical protein